MNSSKNNLLDQIFDRIFCVAGAFVLSQFPRYMTQYMELLSKFTSGKLSTAVLLQKKNQEVTILDLIFKHLKDFGLDIPFGKSFAGNAERIKFYQSSIQEWSQATSIEKPFVFLSNLDLNVVSYFDYTSVLQKDTQSIVYAFFGIFAGALAYKIMIKAPYYIFFTKEKKFSMGKRKKPGFV